MQKKRRILIGELVTNKVLGVEMHNCLKPEGKNLLQLMLLAKVIMNQVCLTWVLWVFTSEGAAATIELLLGLGRRGISGSGVFSGFSSSMCRSLCR